MKKIKAIFKPIMHPLKGLDALIEWMAQDAGLPPIEPTKRPDDKAVKSAPSVTSAYLRDVG